MNDLVQIELTKAEALVLFELVHDLEEPGFELSDPVDEVALWRLQAALEKTLVEPLRPDYHRSLARARSQLRQRYSAEDGC